MYQLFFSPLRNIPGPLLAKLSQYYIILVDVAGTRTSHIHELHKGYGSAVRIGPSEVSFSNIETIKELYAPATPYMKAPWYEAMSTPPLGVFSLTDKKAHSDRRRLVSHVFSQSNLLETEPLVAQHVSNLAKRVRNGVGKPLNMLGLFRSFSLDVVGDLFLGRSFEALDSDELPQFAHDVDYNFILRGIGYAFPWLEYILYRLPIPSVKYFITANDRIAAFAKNAFYDYIDQHGRDSGRKDLLTKMLAIKSEDARLSDKAAYLELANFIFAGTDTTSTTLVYLFWELARHPEWQQRLKQELDTHLKGDNLEIPKLIEVQDLPILEAVTNEALRLHPAAPASLVRVVPRGGRTLNGHFMPENTVVSMQCYTTQRDPHVFPSPDDFKPERWLDEHNVTDDMRELFMPFSRGTRACLGKSLAIMELKLPTATLVRDLLVELAPSATEDCMAMTDHFLVQPKGGKCELIFVGWSQK